MRAWSRLVFLVAVVAAGAFPLGSALAQDQIFDEYTIALATWAKPTVSGQIVDTNVVTLGENVSDILTILVARDANEFVPGTADLAGFCAGVAAEYLLAEGSITDYEIGLPSSLGSSLGYWGKNASGASFLICSLHDDAIYMFTLLSADAAGDNEAAQAVLIRTANEVLTSGPPYQSAYMVELMASMMGGERPLTDLPGRDEIPNEFQLVDRDYMIMMQ